MPTYTVIAPDGNTYGPATEDVLADWARAGRIVKEANYSIASRLFQ